MVMVKSPAAEQGSSCSETELRPLKMHLGKVFPAQPILTETVLCDPPWD